MALGSKYDQHTEDIFSDTRMSFGEHIEDLRTHLLRALFGFVIALVLSFFVGKYVLGFIARPVELALDVLLGAVLQGAGRKGRPRPGRREQGAATVQSPDATAAVHSPTSVVRRVRHPGSDGLRPPHF